MCDRENRRFWHYSDTLLAPRAAWRPEVVRRETSHDGSNAGVTEALTARAPEADTPETARRRARGQCWAELMRRTFGFDVLACPRCGSRLRLIALIEEATVIERILGHLGVPTAVPAPHPARVPPFSADIVDATGWDDHAQVFDSCS